MSKIDILVRWQSRSLGASIFTLGILSGFTIPASAQIIYEGGKVASPSAGTINIPVSEGTLTKPIGGNLFHSFDKFNVNEGQTANFISTPDIQNILGRVNGANGGSLIDGKLQVTGNANLFLMNPAGIVFGKGASLDINGAFTATTAKAIDFNGKWFNAVGTNNYSELTGNPIGLAFTGGTPGSIFSAATFDGSEIDPFAIPIRTEQTVKPGQSITLVGGTVISTGDIKTAGGNISIATVEGGKYVQIKVEGNILGLSLPTSLPTSANSINSVATNFAPLRLAELLTNTGVDLAATGVKNENDTITLVGDPVKIATDINLGDTVSKQNRSISSGDVVTKNLDTSVTGKNGGNVYITSSQSILSGDITTSYKNPQSSPPDNPLKIGGTVILKAQTEIKTKRIDTSARSGSNKGYNGGNVTLFTKTKDIIVDSITTIAGLGDDQNLVGKLTRAEAAGFIGGDVTVNAAGLFRVIDGGISSSLFGVIEIDHGSTKPFASGFTFGPGFFPGSERAILKPDFIFPEGASGTRGVIATSSNSNGTVGTVYRDQPIDGISIKGQNNSVPPEKPPSNPDQQASRPKSKENCTPSSTAVASNPTAAPTRSAGNANAVSADPCQQNTSNNGILQILTDRN